MKKQITLLLVAISLTLSVVSQENAFVIEYVSGNLRTIDLTDATLNTIGNASNNIGALEFGPEEVLYGINSTTNQFIEIDTSDASVTNIGSITPPASHIWTGLAYDPNTAIMYAISAQGTASGTSTLHTVDVTDGSVTEIGSQSTATAISCIAIDADGQMYGLQLGTTPKMYLIDKSDGSVSLLGDVTSFGGAGMGYGMDYDTESGTMYLTAYDSFSFENKLYTVDLSDGSASEVGDLDEWTGALAIISGFSCDFSADVTEICTSGTVNFTDESNGAVSWSWTFEGGTPSSSTEQNPSVVYNTAGTYDVSLEVMNTLGDTESETKTNYIYTAETPAQCDMPEGETEVCTGQIVFYSTSEVSWAEEYEWEITPEEAAILTANDNEATLEFAEDWTGDFTLKVRASNACGVGEWSDNMNGTVSLSPSLFETEGGGSYCLNGEGVEITVNGSEDGINYELYLDGEPTGNIIAGTGSEISFGLITEEGYYTTLATNDNCEEQMDNQVEVEIIYPPLEPETPTGPVVVCNDETSEYESEGAPDADSYVWVLDPENAGEITMDGLTVTVAWNTGYSGTALVSLYGLNDCGEGNASMALEVTVDAVPEPEIEGNDQVCNNSTEVYSTAEIDGATYTWDISGGEISDGQGTNSISVDWEEPGDGYVSLAMETEAGCSGNSEDFYVLIDDCTGIGGFSSASEIYVHPNPAKDKLYINAKSGIREVRFTDLRGNILLETMPAAVSTQINTSSLNPGIYVVQIVTENDIIIRKVIIED
ncbi:MAG: T9SS type A sorting domain-containing protein [bacterium]